MRKLLGALAIAGLAILVAPSGAEAATCWWNGYTWVCRMPPYAGYWGWGPHWRGAWGPWWRHHHWREARGPWRRHHHWRHWGYERPYAWYR
jgi:hypothetical protein